MPLQERLLVQRIREASIKHHPLLIQGIGDDCAVLRIPSRHESLVTTDFCLEGIHFHRDWHPPETVGHRCLTRGLSDIAAMGGKPVAAFLSLALPASIPQRWVDRFFDGFLKLASKFSVILAGGDIAESRQGVLADVIVLGSVPRGRAILRSGAKPGDGIFVTGALGISVATLSRLNSGHTVKPASAPRHFFPEPRVEVGQFLRSRRLPTAMIDTSDGLSTDLQHICDESGTGAALYAEALPRLAGDEGLRNALHGGEDYELLFTAPPGRRVPSSAAGVPITRIGEITRQPGIRLFQADGSSRPLQSAGWEHFARQKLPRSSD